MILLVLAETAARTGAAYDRAWWAELVAAHGSFLERSVTRLTGTRALVDDVVQEAFISAFRRQADLPNDPHKMRAWLYRAARHHLMHAHRSALREQRRVDAWERARNMGSAGATPHDAPAPDDLLVERARTERLRTAMRALPFDMREAFALIELEGMSAVDAAVVVGVPENTLRSRVRRARERLVAMLAAEEA